MTYDKKANDSIVRDMHMHKVRGNLIRSLTYSGIALTRSKNNEETWGEAPQLTSTLWYPIYFKEGTYM